MIEYLNFNHTNQGDIINKINECIRSLNNSKPQTIEICPACDKVIKTDKPPATGFHCTICGSAIQLNLQK